MWLLREGILDEDGINALERGGRRGAAGGGPRDTGGCFRSRSRFSKHVYSEDLRPTDARFATEPKPTADAPERTMADLINACLKDEMRRDERIVVFGEDVADATREEILKGGKVKGKGGVFKLTAGLQTEFGSDRVLELAAGGGEYCGPRHRHGGARAEAGGGDPVLRLHLAGDAPDAQ